MDEDGLSVMDMGEQWQGCFIDDYDAGDGGGVGCMQHAARLNVMQHAAGHAASRCFLRRIICVLRISFVQSNMPVVVDYPIPSVNVASTSIVAQRSRKAWAL